jgi:multidrug resistance efflux pump
MKKIYFSILSLVSHLSIASPLVLTGEITSTEKQTVTAPRTDNWQIQVQWMEEEGKIVNVGDLVAVFDGAGVQSQLAQNRDKLEDEQQKFEKKKLDVALALEEDKNALVIAELEVKKASIEASIPASEISQYDKGQYQLTLERAVLEKVKAEQQYLLRQKENKSELEKQRIQILKITENIRYQEDLLTKLNVTAEVKGPITHAMHPWNGKKVASGTNVQIGWKVIEIQAISDFQVESWVHEIDIENLSEGQSVTLSLDAYPKHKYVGKITRLSKQTEDKEQWSNSSYYPISIKFNQTPTETLLPGMSVRILTDSLARN